MDITDRSAVQAVFHNFQPDVVLHAAAATQVDQCEQLRKECNRINVEGTAHLLEGAQLVGARFVFVSTDFVFNGAQGPYVESDEPAPVNHYGLSKWRAEKLVTQSGLQWAVVRTVLVYGVLAQMGRSNILLWAINSMRKGTPIRVVEDQWRTPTLAEDLADGCLQVMLQQRGGLWHLSGLEMMTPYEFVLKIGKCYGLDTSQVRPTNAAEFRETAKRPPRTGFIINKARTELGYSPRSIEQGLVFLKDQLKGIYLP